MNNIKPASLLLLYSYGTRLCQNEHDNLLIDKSYFSSLNNEEDKLNYILKQLPLNSFTKGYFKQNKNCINSTLSLHLFENLNVYTIFDTTCSLNHTSEYLEALYNFKKEFQKPYKDAIKKKEKEAFVNSHVICCEEVLYQVGEDMQNMKKLYFCEKCKKEYKLNSFDIKTSGVLYRNED